MSDDIVTRLRASTYGMPSTVYHVVMDAIDEIERLQISLKDVTDALGCWKKTAYMMNEKANPKGAPICDRNVCHEYNNLLEGHIKMDITENYKPKYEHLFDRDEYWVITKLADGVMHKTGASFTYKEEADRYVGWLNKGDI